MILQSSYSINNVSLAEIESQTIGYDDPTRCDLMRRNVDANLDLRGEEWNQEK